MFKRIYNGMTTISLIVLITIPFVPAKFCWIYLIYAGLATSLILILSEIEEDVKEEIKRAIEEKESN